MCLYVFLKELHDRSIHLYAGVCLDGDSAIDDSHREAHTATHIQDIGIHQVFETSAPSRQIDQSLTGMFIACRSHIRSVSVKGFGNIQTGYHLMPP